MKLRQLELAVGDPTGELPFWAKRSWWRRTGQTSLGLWAATVLGFAGTVVAARGLGPRSYGAAMLAFSVATLIAVFLDLTLYEAVVHHGARALVAEEFSALRGLLRTALRFDLAIGITVFAGIAASADALAALASRGGSLDPALIRIAALTPLAMTAEGTTGAVLLLAGRPDLRAGVMAATNLLRLLLVVVAVQLGGPAAVLGAFALATAGGGVAQALLSIRYGWRRWPKPETRTGERWGRRLLSFGLHSSVTTSVISMRSALLPVILGKVSGAPAVAMLDVAAIPVSAADVASAPLRMTLLPEQARLAARGEDSLLCQSVRTYTLLGLAIGIPAAVAGWFLLPWLVPALYSEQFADAIWPARILLVAAVAHLAVGWEKTLPAAIGRPKLRTRVSVLEVAVTLVLMAALAHRGAAGAAVAIATASAVAAAVWLLLWHRLLGASGRPDAKKARETVHA